MANQVSMGGAGNLLLWGVIALSASWASAPASQAFVDKAREFTVYIYFDVTDDKTGAKIGVQGTGFVVTINGYVLTASHLFSGWRKQSDVDKSRNEVKGTLRDKPGWTGASPMILRIVNLGDPDAEDVALLKLPEPSPQVYPSVPICYKDALSAKLGEEFIALGFPRNENFQPVRGTLGTQNAQGGRWAAASAFTQGMSGGPVYTVDGRLFGLVKGGLEGTPAVQWITPIAFAHRLLIPPFEEKCAGPSASVNRCQGEVAARSPAGGQSIVFTLKNTRAENVRLFWIDYVGNRMEYFSLGAGRSVSQQTYADHVWVAADMTGNCLQVFKPAREGEELVVR